MPRTIEPLLTFGGGQSFGGHSDHDRDEHQHYQDDSPHHARNNQLGFIHCLASSNVQATALATKLKP